jgi:hypothetical protein
MSVRKFIAAVATLVTIAFVSGCYSTPVMPPTGVIYSNVNAPISLSIAGQNLGTRRGEASCVSLLGLFAWGNCSAKAAADAGAISELKQLDYNFFNFLFVWQKLTTIAYGD